MCILRAAAAGEMTADRDEHAMVVVVLQLQFQDIPYGHHIVARIHMTPVTTTSNLYGTYVRSMYV